MPGAPDGVNVTPHEDDTPLPSPTSVHELAGENDPPPEYPKVTVPVGSDFGSGLVVTSVTVTVHETGEPNATVVGEQSNDDVVACRVTTTGGGTTTGVATTSTEPDPPLWCAAVPV